MLIIIYLSIIFLKKLSLAISQAFRYVGLCFFKKCVNFSANIWNKIFLHNFISGIPLLLQSLILSKMKQCSLLSKNFISWLCFRFDNFYQSKFIFSSVVSNLLLCLFSKCFIFYIAIFNFEIFSWFTHIDSVTLLRLPFSSIIMSVIFFI